MLVRAAILVAAICLTAIAAYAQPSDAQILKDMASPKQLKVELSKGPTKKVWSDAHTQWFWERWATVWLPADIPEYPNAKVVVYGFARYHTGSPASYREFKTSSNSYEGIPSPSNDEILVHARKYVKEFVGAHRFNQMVELKSISVADDPKVVWHTPNSISMDFVTVADMIISDVEVATVTVRQETRFYRDAVNEQWKSFMVSVDRDVQEENKRTFSPDEIRAMPTMGSRLEEENAAAALAALGEVEIPEFKRDVDVFMYTNKLLREGTAEQFEAYLMRMLAPSYFVDGSTIRLTPQGADLINKAVNSAFKGKSTYKEQYCADPGVKHQQENGMEWWNATQDAHTRMGLIKAGGAWKNGQKTGEAYKIVSLEVWMLTTPDDIARIRSYDPGMLCKGAAVVPKAAQQTTGGSTSPATSGGSDLLKKGKGFLDKVTKP